MKRTTVNQFDFETNIETVTTVWESIGRSMIVKNFYDDSVLEFKRSEVDIFNDNTKTIINHNEWDKDEGELEYFDYTSWLFKIITKFEEEEKKA